MQPSEFVPINESLIEARESELISRSKTGTNYLNGKETWQETCILTATQLISENGQEQFYFIELNNKVVNVLEIYHMISAQNMIDRYKGHLIAGHLDSWVLSVYDGTWTCHASVMCMFVFSFSSSLYLLRRKFDWLRNRECWLWYFIALYSIGLKNVDSLYRTSLIEIGFF